MSRVTAAGEASIEGVVRRRRAYRTVTDEEGEGVFDDNGDLEYMFDFEIWPLPAPAATAAAASAAASSHGGGEKVHVFLRNHIAEECQTIKPTDRVRIRGTGITFAPPKRGTRGRGGGGGGGGGGAAAAAAANDSGGVEDGDSVAHVDEPCSVQIWRSIPSASGDASTQVVYGPEPETLTFRRRTRQSPARAPPQPTPPRAKRARRMSPGAAASASGGGSGSSGGGGGGGGGGSSGGGVGASSRGGGGRCVAPAPTTPAGFRSRCVDLCMCGHY